MSERLLLSVLLLLAIPSLGALGEASEQLLSAKTVSGAPAQPTGPQLAGTFQAGSLSAGPNAAAVGRRASEAARNAGHSLGVAERRLGDLAATLPSEIRAELTSELFADIQQAGERFRRTFPAQERWFVGVGRSPHPLLGYIQIREPDALIQYMPLSNANKAARALSELPMAEQSKRAQKISQHFAEHLPSREQLGERTLTLVDYSFTGATMHEVKKHVYHVAKQQGIPTEQIELVALEARPGFLRMPTSYERGVNRFLLFEQGHSEAELPLFFGIARARPWVQDTAPVGRFDLQSLEHTSGVAEERYQALLDWMRMTLARSSTAAISQDEFPIPR